MRLFTLQQFKLLPEGTVFMRYSEHQTGELSVKAGYLVDGDVVDCPLVDSSPTKILPFGNIKNTQLTTQVSMKIPGMEWTKPVRDNEDQLFLVFEEKDIDVMMARLEKSRALLVESSFDVFWGRFTASLNPSNKSQP